MKYQELSLEYMEQRGFNKKYQDYYKFKIKGLYTYLLLANKKQDMRDSLQKYNCGIFIKISYFLLSFIPVSLVELLLKCYRKRRIV